MSGNEMKQEAGFFLDGKCKIVKEISVQFLLHLTTKKTSESFFVISSFFIELQDLYLLCRYFIFHGLSLG